MRISFPPGIRSRRIAGGIAVLVAGVVALPAASAQVAPRDSIEDERAYAIALAAIADRAIHRLDFFPARAQMRVQTAFLSSPNDSTAVPFAQIASISATAASAIEEDTQRFAGVVVPDDLKGLHRDLVNSLRAAISAADRLSQAAGSCRVSTVSVQRCQSPFTSASAKIATAYRDYLATRAKIAAQVLDTNTELIAFKVASR